MARTRGASSGSPSPQSRNPMAPRCSVLGPGHKGFQLHGGRGPLGLRLLLSRPGWPLLPSLMSSEPRAGLAVDVTLGRSCYLQEFCLMGATVKRTQAERAEGPQDDLIPPSVRQRDVPSGLRLDTRVGLRGPPGRGFSLAGGMRSCGESRSVWS